MYISSFSHRVSQLHTLVVGVHAFETLSTCCNLCGSESLTARAQGFKSMNTSYSVGNYYLHRLIEVKN